MAAAWDAALDAIERTIDLVEDALVSGDPIPELPPFEPPADVMPPMSSVQQQRADQLMRRQSGVTRRLSAQIVSTRSEMTDLRRRRRAATTYGRTG